MKRIHLLQLVAVIGIIIVAMLFPILSRADTVNNLKDISSAGVLNQGIPVFPGSGVIKTNVTISSPITVVPFMDSGIILPGVYQGSLAWGDYDNDGDLDLVVCGQFGEIDSIPITKIYRNNGNGTFTDIQAELTGVAGGRGGGGFLAWGDYDNDGNLDLAICGYDASYNQIIKIYRNNGNDSFTDSGITLPGMSSVSSLAWGDYDNDGDLDLAVCGNYTTKIYRNNGNNSFTDSVITLTGVAYGSLAWGDYDNDGYLDLAVSGNNVDGEPITKIYRNNGDNTFIDIGAELAGLAWGSLAWGDYDNDGDLDLAVCGSDVDGEPITKIYKNNGDNTFIDSGITLTGLMRGSLAWGDYDNDGKLDLAVSGLDIDGEPITIICRNNGNNSFIDSVITLTGVAYGSLAWGDYDKDGYLDLAICGEYITKIYKNVGNYNPPNTTPSAPTNLTYEEDSEDTALILKWNSGSDADTPNTGLYYNVRVGTSPGANDIVSGVYGSPLLGNYLRPRFADGELSVKLELPGGIYYWSVQTIDTGLQASSWSEEEFVIYGDKLHFSASDYTVPEREPSVTITVTHTEPTTGVTTVHYSTSDGTATAGEDYVATSGTLIFNEGDILETFVVPIINNDDISEGNETINLTLSEPTPEGTILGDPSTATITIYKKIPFVDSFKILPQIAGGSLAWGDYDNDGDLDLALCGAILSDARAITAIYKNSNGVLTDIGAGLPGFRDNSSLAWGDYDNDGDLDLAICGTMINNGKPTTIIYRNNGDDTFTDIQAGLTGVSWGSLAWGDFDNDGDLDLAVCGSNSAKIYRNNGDDTFTYIEAGLTGMSMGCSIAWGDYDNDGDLDLAVCGNAPGTITKIYRNNGDNTFTDIGAGLTGVSWGSLAWGDYDNDGYLDLAVCGYDSVAKVSITKIYANNGDGTFTDIEAELPGVAYSGSLAWGDYDNDGDLDLAVCGNSASETITRIYRNNGNGTFTDINAGLTGVDAGYLAWGDYDNDGDLDLVVCGRVWDGHFKFFTKLYENLEADASLNGGNNPNTAPSAPTDLTYYEQEDSALILWNSGSDAETAETGLYYNVRVGTTSGANDIVSGVYGSPLLGNYLRPKLSSDQLGVRLNNLPGGTYYWSVQTIDTSLKASQWSNEETFVVSQYIISGKVTIEGGSSNVTDVSLSLSGALTETIHPTEDGNYSFTGLEEGFYTVTPSLEGYHFLPANRVYTLLDSDQLGQDFTGLYETYDSDLDGLPDWWEFENFGNLNQTPTNDPDSDALNNLGEYNAGTNPNNSDTDQDGMPDGWEVAHNLNPLINDANDDADNDGFTNLAEYLHNTDPNDPNSHPAQFVDSGINLVGLLGWGSFSWGDYDNDGDLDLAICGATGQSYVTGGITKIYRNDGNNTFTDIEAGIPGVYGGSVAWGDYNNDGNLDLAVAGYSPEVDQADTVFNTGTITRIYRNNGDGTFTDINAGLLGVYDGQIAWGDYNNDGNLDLAICGFNPHTPNGDLTKIYRNNGDGTFTDINAQIIQLGDGCSLAWGDYNNDGYLDLVVSGWSWGQDSAITKIYRNNGNDTFTDIGAGLIAVKYSSLAWGDYDNDGDLDLALCGVASGGGNYITKIYRNDGNNTFTDIGAGIAGVQDGWVAWGDYNNDGYLDLAVCGDLVYPKGAITSIYRNNGNGTFTDIGAGLQGVDIGSFLAWGDYDNDGDIDLVVAGSNITKIYKNLEAEGKNNPNIIPSAPTNLTYEEGSAILKWSAGSDEETPETGLYYNVRVGTTSGANDIVSGVYGSPLLGNYLRPKLSDEQLGVRLKELPVGTYYWSVQTIDTGLKASQWSSENTFVITNPTYTISGEVTLAGGDSGDSIIEDFTGFSSGPWLPSTPGVSYDADCSNGWKGYIEDIYSHSGWDPDSTWIINNKPEGAADGAYLKTSQEGMGNLWLYKTFTTELGQNISINTSYRITKKSSIGSPMGGGIYVWNGTVKPCMANRETGGGDASNPGSTANAIASDTTTCDSNGWCSWVDANLSAHITDSTFTVGYMINDGWEALTTYMDIDYLNISSSATLSVKDVVLSLSGASINTTHPDIDGNYSFTGLEEGFYTVTPYAEGYHFSPDSRFYPHLNSNQSNQYFTGLYETYDSDTDSLPDWWELKNFGNLDQIATNDPDGDGLNNLGEYNAGTNPNNSDTDSDGMPDGWEVVNHLNPLINDANADADNDGFTNLAEYLHNTDPNDPNSHPAQFVDSGINLTGAEEGSLVWGDYDKDGDLDLAVCGQNVGESVTYITKIYRNNGDGTFTDINAELAGLDFGSLAWGDYDNDGDLDLAISGYDNNLEPITKIYRNDGYDTFTDINAGLPGLDTLSRFSVAWGDYDNDGDLDLAMCSGTVTTIYRNNGNNSFTDSGITLAGVRGTLLAWGDYDNDGYLDLAVSGYNADWEYITTIYRNNGNNSFTDSGITLAGVCGDSLAWGDYNNDGYLDLALCGRNADGEPIAKIYRNNGDNTFTNKGAELTGVYFGSLAWGDYDNDGYLDLAICGNDVDLNPITKIYRNSGDNTFTDIGAELPGVGSGFLAWGDYDKDGYLDLAICGGASSGQITKIYKNVGNRHPNTAPASPTGLTYEKESEDSAIILKWNSGSDAETSETGLYYNVRVGTTSEADDIVSGVYGSPLLGNYLRPKVSLEQLGIRLKGLPAGTYYWSVQTIDTSLKASQWSQEETFIITNPNTIMENFIELSFRPWLPSTPGVSYDADCSNEWNEWKGYIEDVYSSYNPDSTFIINNTPEGAADGAYLKTSANGLGTLWLYKTFTLAWPNQNVSINTPYRITKKTTSGSPMVGGVYIWNGTVKPCSANRETGGGDISNPGSTANAIASNTTTCDSNGWCSWVDANLSAHITDSTFTVGYMINDGWNNKTTYMDIDYLSISNAVILIPY